MWIKTFNGRLLNLAHAHGVSVTSESRSSSGVHYFTLTAFGPCGGVLAEYPTKAAAERAMNDLYDWMVEFQPQNTVGCDWSVMVPDPFATDYDSADASDRYL